MITPTALQRLARRAVLMQLKGHAPLIALVPKDSINPIGTPEWPIVLVEAPRGTPRRMSCANGVDASFDVHAFASNIGSSKTGYDHASEIGAAIETALAPNNITLEDGSHCKLSFSDMRMLKDADPDHWHWFAQLNCRVLKAVA
jgi:hypothetical protein